MKKNQYDALIIGGGISGLITGCYLAKAKKSILILEKNPYPGGCCCAFPLGKFKMESGIHAIEGFHSHFIHIMRDLDLPLKFSRREITDIILFKNKKAIIFSDFTKTIAYFRDNLKIEESDLFTLQELFTRSAKTLLALNQFHNFQELLDLMFKNHLLKKIILTLLRNTGTPAENLNPINGIFFLKAYLTDNGYYFIDGIDVLPRALKEKFLELGGEIRFSSKVEKILVENKVAIGARTIDNKCYYSQKVIVASDFQEAISKLLGLKDVAKKMRRLKTTVSAFLIYAIVRKFPSFTNTGALWLVDDGNFNAKFREIFYRKKVLIDTKVMMLGFLPTKNEKQAIFVTTSAKFESKKIWDTIREKLCAELIKKIEKRLNCSVGENILDIKTATPNTFYKFTGNYLGSLHGWAPNETAFKFFLKNPIPINNLYLTGHWKTGYGQGGIPWALESAINTSNRVLNNYAA